MMSDLDRVFKFKLGDVCMHAALAHIKILSAEEDRWMRFSGHPIRLMVISRVIEECSGGVQRIYLCRPVTGDGVVHNNIQIHEHELMPYPPFVEPTKKGEGHDDRADVRG